MTPNTRERPASHRELLEAATDAAEPVTEIERTEGCTRVHAVQEADGIAVRVRIEHRPDADDGPRVRFYRSAWTADVGVLRDWSEVAVGSYSGPEDLASWQRLFATFDAALEAFEREVRERDPDGD